MSLTPQELASDEERQCIACYTPCTTRLILVGSPEWFAYACERLEIPIKEARALLRMMAEEHAPYGANKAFRTGRHRLPPKGNYVLAVCMECALTHGLQVGSGKLIPSYVEPADS